MNARARLEDLAQKDSLLLGLAGPSRVNAPLARTRPHARVLALLALACLSSCRCKGGLETANGQVELSPLAVDFGDLPLEQRASADVHVTNVGRAPLTLQLSTSEPFAISHSELTLAGGASETVVVTFQAQHLGAASGVLLVTADQGVSASVELTGTGVSACPLPATCHRVSFDESSRACVDGPLANGTECQATCLHAGQCQDGQCVGTLDSCDDHDACTSDACSPELDGGCLHAPIVCPVTDACLTAVCLPTVGCTGRPVDDGVECGPSDCLESRVCMDQHCVTRVTPNSADCQYTSVVGSNGSQLCATTVSGKVRCWGHWQPPHVVPQATGAALVRPFSVLARQTSDGEGVCTLTSADQVSCLGLAGPVGGLGGSVREFNPPCAVLTDGRYRCWDVETGVVTTERTGVDSAEVAAIDGNVVRCFLANSAMWCEARSPRTTWQPVEAPFPEPPDRLVTPEVSRAMCAEWRDTLRCRLPEFLDENGGLIMVWDDAVTFDAGLILGGSVLEDSTGPSEFASGTAVWSAGFPAYHMADPVLQLTNRTSGAQCLLTSGHEVWCWGVDNYGGLGQLTGNPRGVVQLPAKAEHFAVSDDSVVFTSDGGLWQLGGTSPVAIPDDAGFRRAGLTSFGPLAAPSALMVSRWSGVCGLTQHRGWCVGHGFASDWSDVQHPHDLGVADALVDGWADLDVAVLRGTQLTRIDGGVLLDGIDLAIDGCARWLDGGVQCRMGMNTVKVALTDVPLQLSGSGRYGIGGWCALLAGDRVECWSPESDGGLSAPRPISGTGPGIRQLAGSPRTGCVLAGANLVQCWGTNAVGDGVDWPGVARPLVFAEPVRDLTVSGLGGFACVRGHAGALLCWGRNTWGQFGAPPMVTNTPVKLTR